MDLLPDSQNCGLRMRRECRERFPCHRLQRKRLVSNPGMHHGTCVTHVPWCMSGSQTHRYGENLPGIPGACASRNFTYLARSPWCKNYPTSGRRDMRYYVLVPKTRDAGVRITKENTYQHHYWFRLIAFSIMTTDRLSGVLSPSDIDRDKGVYK